MQDQTAYTIENIRADADELNNYRNQISSALDELENNIVNLNDSWASTETQTYENMKAIYEDNRKHLQEGLDYLDQFINALKVSADNFEATDKRTNAGYEF